MKDKRERERERRRWLHDLVLHLRKPSEMEEGALIELPSSKLNQEGEGTENLNVIRTV